MAQPSDLEARVATLEARVGELAREARAAREDAPLPGTWPPPTTGTWPKSAARYATSGKATAASFNAMRSDLTDLQTEMRTGFTQAPGQLDGAAAGLVQITSLLNPLIAQHGDQPGKTS